MRCYNCGCRLSEKNFCTSCGADVTLYKKIIYAANRCYNEGLEKAKVRDLSGAITSLRQCIKFNKNHIDARNLLGLIYYERGEVVAALSEWVISKNIQNEKNIADDYINMIQNNPGRLDSFNQTIKKYNQALAYCKQDSLDLAVIQLKKVLSMNPKFLQAHLLLALLYMEAQDWEKADKELDKALSIDTNHTMALRYKKVVEESRPLDDDKPKKKEAIRYQSGNETVIQPIGKKDNIVLHTIINIMVGLVVGIGVTMYMIVPAKVKATQDTVSTQLKAVSEQLDAKTVQVDELKKQIEGLHLEKDSLSDSLNMAEGATGALQANTDLVEAIMLYLTSGKNEAQKIAETLELIPAAYLEQNATESFQAVYNILLEEVGPSVASSYYTAGYEAYRTEDYQVAIENLTKAFTYDKTNVEAIYNLANAYYKSGDTKRAVECFQQVIDEFPDTERARKAAKYITEIQG